MRVKGTMKGKLFVLGNSGSTHNFLALELAKKLRRDIKSTPTQAVSVANGNHLDCKHVCKGF